jgi:uncharacterized protein (DUF736 family)
MEFKMKIGEMHEKVVSGKKRLNGFINTLAFSMAFEMHEAPKTQNPNSPSFIIFGKSNSGTLVQIGGAWIKHIKKGENTGEEFLTMTIDDPSLQRALNVAAFKNPETGLWDIMFRRRQESAA